MNPSNEISDIWDGMDPLYIRSTVVESAKCQLWSRQFVSEPVINAHISVEH